MKQFASHIDYSLTKKRFLMMSKKSNKTLTILKKGLLMPSLFIPILLFSVQINAQESAESADFYESDHSYSLSNLEIESHPENENVAIIKLFLKVESSVMFQLFNNDRRSMIVNEDLSAGRHTIHFDYSAITKDDFRFKFKYTAGNDTHVEIDGPFLKEGKLIERYRSESGAFIEKNK